MRKCLLIAEKRGYKRIHGIVLKENRNMLAPCQKLGFLVDGGENSGEYEIQIKFAALKLVEGLAVL